jgi:hypothetical protein
LGGNFLSSDGDKIDLSAIDAVAGVGDNADSRCLGTGAAGLLR